MLLTIGPGGCGFTFLNWSISFLRGDSFYQTLDGVKHEITSNPLSGTIAHNYIKDHIRIEDSKNQFVYATEQSIIYSTPGCQTDFEYLLTLPGKKIIFDTTDYSKILMARAMIHIPKANSPYIVLIDQLGKTYDTELIQEVLLECHKFFMQYYKLPSNINNLYAINYNILFNYLDIEITKIFAYLELKIDPVRLIVWQAVYSQYKSLNQRDYCAEVVPHPSASNLQKSQIFKEILKWKNGLFQST